MDYSTQTPRETCSCPPGAHSLEIRIKMLQRFGRAEASRSERMASLAVEAGYGSWAATETALLS